MAGTRTTTGITPRAVVSYYKPDLLGGNHEFKVGVDHLYSSFNDGYDAIGPNNELGYQLAVQQRRALPARPRRTRRSKG